MTDTVYISNEKCGPDIDDINRDYKKPLISVVICAFSSKRFDMTVHCINSIIGGLYKNYEIILVIDGNHELKERMEERFKGSNITIVENEKNEGPSISRNKGVEYAKGDIVAFIDDDAYASYSWLDYIARDFNDYPDISIVGGKLLLVYEKGSEKLPEEILWLVGGTYKGHPEDIGIVRNVFTGNMSIKREVLNDTNFEIMCDKKKNKFLSHQLEDTLLCVRINNKKPGSVLYDPKIVAFHHVPEERLKILYLLRRSFSEGILKGKLGNIRNDNGNNNKNDIGTGNNNTLAHEQSYLSNILMSIIRNFFTLNVRDGILLSLVVLSVGTGYTLSLLKKDI